MEFKRFYDDDLAQASYAIGCSNSKKAMIIDPLRDIDRYVDWAESSGFEIVQTFETHVHADFLSGARELAAGTGAELLLSAAGDYENLDGLDVRALGHGDVVKLGSLKMRVHLTPGHTMEHLCLSVLDSTDTDRLVFTGDFMFDGELGRPDLAEQCEELADLMYNSLKRFLGGVANDAVAWPGHGSGSACGRSLGDLPATTPGREARAAWWAEFLARDDRKGFVAEFTRDLPASPRYFAEMKARNCAGPEILCRTPIAPRLSPARFRALADDGAVVVDCRSAEDFADKHVDRSFAPQFEKLSTYSGAVLPYDRALVLVCDPSNVDEASRKLMRVGFDDVRGWVPSPGEASNTSSIDRLEPDEAYAAVRDGAAVLDVRGEDEYAEGHIPDAINIPYVELPDRYDELDPDRDWVVHCASGRRATLAVSLLGRHDFDSLVVFPRGTSGWKSAGHRLVTEN